MASSSILVLCSAFSADASDPVIDLPDVIVKPAVTPVVLAFDLSPSVAQDHISHLGGCLRQ